MVGAMATSFLLFRILNHAVKFFKYRNGSIKPVTDGIEIKNSAMIQKISADDITYAEVNLLGNLIIRDKITITSFPLQLLEPESREKLLSQFDDMAPKRTAVYRKIWEFVDAIVVALVLAVHIIQYVVQAYYIPTGSMEDTLLKDDHLFVEKITYGPIIPKMFTMKEPVHIDSFSLRSVQRGDIVIFRPPHERDKDYIKRCIALPGDKLELKEGYVYINGKKQDEPYVKGLTYDPVTNRNSSRVQGIVPEGKVVVFGDNRENSSDSRFWGYLDIKEIKGRAFILYWNKNQIFDMDFSRFGLIR